MKNFTLKRLTSLGLFILLLFCVLSPFECFADSTRYKDAKMTVGDTKELTSATYTTFTYEWTIESGSDIVSILSGTTSDTCVIRAENAGNAVVKVVYTRYSPRIANYTIIYKIAVSMPSYTVKLDANGGSVYPTNVTIKDNELISLPTPTRYGYGFLGWFTDTADGLQINSGDTIHITGDMKLYAHWEQQQSDEISTPSTTTMPPSTTTPPTTTTPSYPSDDPFCGTCDGLGDCPKCFGMGYDDCSSCILGRCTHCGGTGEILSYSFGDVKSRSCTYCRGSGSCSRCNGNGKIMCSRCGGRGICPTCNGSGFKPGRSLDEHIDITPTPSTLDVPLQNPAASESIPGTSETPAEPESPNLTGRPGTFDFGISATTQTPAPTGTSDKSGPPIAVIMAVAFVAGVGLTLFLKKRK